MPKSKFDSFPISSFEELENNFPLVLEYWRDDFNNTYGIGNDVTGTLDVADNLVDTIVDSETDITITGEWTFATHPLGLLHDLVGNLDWASSGHTLTDFIAGAGLTGGGTIASDRTFNVGAGTAITVNANDVAVDIATLEPLIDHSDIDELEWSLAGHIIDANLNPDSDNTRDLGTSSLNWNNLYLNKTQGSVLFMGAAGLVTEDNSNLFWDDTNNWLGIGTNSPDSPIHILDNTPGVKARIQSSSTAGGAEVGFRFQNPTETWTIAAVHPSGNFFIGTTSVFPLVFTNAAGSRMIYGDSTGLFINQLKSNIDFSYSGDTTADIIVFDAGNESLDVLTNVPLTLGTGRRSLISNDGTDLVIQSDAVGIGAVKTTAGRIVNTTRLTSGDSPYTVLATDHIIICDTDGGAIEVDLTAGAEGKEYRISNVGSSDNDVTVDPNGAEQIFSGGVGVAFVMVDSEGITINYNGTEGWW